MVRRLALLSLTSCLLLLACGPTTATPRHGTLSDLSRSTSEQVTLCEHKVPREVCTRCNPSLEARFKAVNDWCPEHGVPESQCLLCHPDLTFAPLPALPPGADYRLLSTAGEDVKALGEHAVAGKVTIFDFYADWCAPCRSVDEHVHRLLQRRSDVAYRKLNMVSWETPLAKRYLAKAPTLPFVVVFGRGGGEVGRVSGLDLATLDRLIEKAGAPR
jgi:thiol-disulfide isomerase/thioredoxin